MKVAGPWQWVMAGVLLVGIALCAVTLYHGISVGGVAIEYSARPVMGILLSATLAVVSACWLWQLIVFTGAGVSIGWRQSLVGLSALLIGKYIPGKVFGLIGRVATITPLVGVRRASVFAIVEQAAVVLGLTLIGAMAWAHSKSLAFYWMFIGVAIIAVVVVPRAVGLAMLGRTTRWPRVQALLEVLIRFSPLRNLRLLVCALLAVLGTVMTSVFVPELLGVGLSEGGGYWFVFAYSVAIIAGMVAVFMPAGIGAREAVFVALAQPVMTFEQAAAVAAALRLVNVTVDAAVGLVGLALLRFGR